ncbi:Ribulokinase [subsurface metagenome]
MFLIIKGGWKESITIQRKNQFRQHPLDHIESLEESITIALEKVPKSTADNVIGIGVDTTGSTPGLIKHQS